LFDIVPLALFKCPFCRCYFCTKADLDRHLVVFGVGAVHAWRFVGIHCFDPKLSKRERASGFAQLSF
jgi:hypothetical protein